MAMISTRDYRSKKDFAAALEKAAGFDRFVVADPRGAEKDVGGNWSTDRMARGENATLAMYMDVASQMAEIDFRKFVEISGRFVATAAKKAESDAGRNGKPSYYAEWQAKDGEKYYIFRSLGNAAKYEQLWDWANGMGVELRLSCLTAGETPERAETTEETAAEETEEETAETTDEAVDAEADEEADEEEALPRVTARNCSIVTKDGKFCLYDNDVDRFITIPWDGAEGGVREMLEFEPIHMPAKHSFGEEDDDGAKGELLGYRYRLEKDGAWGFISRCFSQSLPPRFSEFRVRKFVAHFTEPPLWSWSLCEKTDEEETARLELWYAVERETQREGESDLVMNSALELVKSWYDEAHEYLSEADRLCGFKIEVLPDEKAIPGEKPFIYITEGGLVNADVPFDAAVIYAPDSEGECFAVNYTQSGGFRNFQSCSVSAENYIVKHGGDKAMPFWGWSDFWHKAEFGMNSMWLDSAPWYAADELAYLGGSYYAVWRDGYWAIMNFFWRNKPVTPYAFTRIEPLKDQDGKTHAHFLLERFGKRGVASMEGMYEKAVKYPVPCEYERIQLKVEDKGLFADPEGRFLVSRMGFTGELDLDGNWLVHLHREEAAQGESEEKDGDSSAGSDFSNLFVGDGGEDE